MKVVAQTSIVHDVSTYFFIANHNNIGANGCCSMT